MCWSLNSWCCSRLGSPSMGVSMVRCGLVQFYGLACFVCLLRLLAMVGMAVCRSGARLLDWHVVRFDLSAYIGSFPVGSFPVGSYRLLLAYSWIPCACGCGSRLRLRLVPCVLAFRLLLLWLSLRFFSCRMMVMASSLLRSHAGSGIVP